MSAQAWFRYESYNGRYGPVVIYEKRKPEKGERFTEAHPVPKDCLSEDGSPLFGRLQERFPAPTEVST